MSETLWLTAQLYVAETAPNEPDGDEGPPGSIPRDITVVGNVSGLAPGTPPQAPRVVSVFQASNAGAEIVGAGVVANAITGAFPVRFFRLYHGSSPTGPWALVDQRAASPRAVENLLFDAAPTIGAQRWYAATAVDSAGSEGPKSPTFPFTAFTPKAEPAADISQDFFGPYPLLGQDVFVSPLTGEAQIGPNGDLLTVGGLACLAQDLRLRLLSEVGELLLHPDYGFGKGKLVGAGQARREVQAQILRANVMDALRAEPRVLDVLAVDIDQYDEYSWLVSYVVMAIGVEDPQRLNLVFPFYEVTT